MTDEPSDGDGAVATGSALGGKIFFYLIPIPVLVRVAFMGDGLKTFLGLSEHAFVLAKQVSVGALVVLVFLWALVGLSGNPTAD